ncbi:hypothetical protein ALC57_03185 [Trachymyrmex cornetzi]|uniref:Uncharacterized protein n=1 Tax=Trachymyrmex cornetzi TaxID=471704 RepID=A0A151JM78_9HYME|nr:hypothetical protein ALC57_03185 [Trachymyrmex cornetzi]
MLASPILKAGKCLSEDTVQEIKDFYQSDENSRIMAGMKDTVTAVIDGQKVKKQKRLLLFNLNDLYINFKEGKNDDIVGFSTFAKLRPVNCIPGKSGTHSVCVCTIHQNCKLMLDAINISRLTHQLQTPINDYKDCLKVVMCNNPSVKCHFNECSECPDEQNLVDILDKLLSDKLITSVLFSTWKTNDRATLCTQKLPADEFLTELCSKLKQLNPHNFIAKEQTNYMTKRKDTLRDDEIIVELDFAENYAFIVQEAAQAFHFNNDQCTIHTIVYYYRSGAEVKHQSVVALSDCLSHDTTAVYVIQKILLQRVQEKHNVKKVIYFTDGAKQHFKNRYQMANLLCHEQDFGIKAEWHFHATAHGKGACDGVGAAFKREATRASLQAPASRAILTSKSLFDWAQNRFDNIDVFFYSKEMYKKAAAHFNRRFKSAPAIPNIQKSHSFVPLDGKTLIIKTFSSSENNTIFTCR